MLTLRKSNRIKINEATRAKTRCALSQRKKTVKKNMIVLDLTEMIFNGTKLKKRIHITNLKDLGIKTPL